MTTNLTALSAAMEALASHTRVAMETRQTGNAPLAAATRSGAIQAFTLAYELALKTLHRILAGQSNLPAVETERMTFRALIQLGAESGYIRAPSLWETFRAQRNAVVHTYDDTKAAEMLEAIPTFLAEGQALLAALQEAGF